MKELDTNELITGVINTFALKVERYNGKIESDLKATDPIIFADEMHITNVIFNLMDNAVKYKRPDVDLQLMVKTWNEPGKVMISVQDNGIGIKKENLKRYLISSIACIQVICTMLRGSDSDWLM